MMLLERIRSGKNKEEIVILVQCLSLMSKAVGSKLAPYLKDIITLLVPIAKSPQDSQSIDLDNELSEACLTTLNAMIRRCPREVSQFIPDLFEISMELLKYDPNYMYDDNE